MGSQWGQDRYYRKAVREGYRSRAAYKLWEIQDRFHIIRPGDTIVDLGAAPGSWLQALSEMTDGLVIGVDLNPIASIENTRTIIGDFTKPDVQQRVKDLVDEVSVIVCDASPKLSGQKSYDQARAIALGEDALSFAVEILKPGGNFLVKSFQGELFHELLEEIRAHFRSVKVYRVKASRKGSTEAYIVAKNFRGNITSEEQ
jgi:23S rRNA (uridine2552-2'-O)-methyltransferase